MITLSVRGAVSVDRNTSESIQSAVVKLVSLLEKENGIREEDAAAGLTVQRRFFACRSRFTTAVCR